MSVIYLDNAATSWPKPPPVEREMRRFLAEDAGNPGRAGHRMAIACERMLDDLRSRLDRLFEGDGPERVVFTLNATDALNIAIKGVVRPGDHVITTALEHNSVSRPLQAMADAGTIELTRIGVTGGFIAPEAVASAIRPNTRLIACTHCSNVIGTIQPIEQIGRIAREHGVLLLVDAAQSAGLLPISMREMRIDLLAVTGHKSLLGPTGTGALLVDDRVDLRPWREGGTGGDSASPTQPMELPHRLEGGTPNTVGLAGLTAALRELEHWRPDATIEHEQALAAQFIEAFRKEDRVRLLGPDDPDRRTGVVAFTVQGVSGQEVASILDESFGIAVRAGLHCAPYLHRALGTFPEGAVRFSPGPYSTEKDLSLLIQAVRMIAEESARG
jgi:cysteine desulfurase family protein